MHNPNEMVSHRARVSIESRGEGILRLLWVRLENSSWFVNTFIRKHELTIILLL